MRTKFRLALTTLTLAALLLSVFGTAPAMAQAGDRGTAITDAADRLANMQNNDGGFDWVPDGNSGIGSTTNTLGVTAMAILKAHELEDKTTYETALAKAYKYAHDNSPDFTWDGDKYNESTKGVDSFPDVTFLVWLAQAAAQDATLLSAIGNQVTGTTAADIANLAKTRWDNRVSHLGSTQESPPNGTATLMAERIRDVRHGQNYDSLIPWDLENGVKAALALDSYFPGQGYDTQADDIAQVIDDSVDDTAGIYFSSADTTQEDYVAGLTGAIEAFHEVGQYLDKASALKDRLIGIQQSDGSWKYYGASPVEKSVQSTAYAVMALFAQGDNDAVTAATEAADWLVSSQRTDGGWYAEGGSGAENLEVDSEAAWALAHPTMWLELASPGWLAECKSDTIIVAVMMTAGNFNGVEFNLDFDETLLQVVDADGSRSGVQISKGTMWPGSATDLENTVDNSTGIINFAAYLQAADTDMSVSGGQVARIEFEELNKAGTSDLDLNEVIVSNLEGASIEPVELQDGSLKVKGCGCVHGIVEVQGRFGPDWDGAEVTLSGGPGGSYGPEISASNGYWQICDVVEGDYDVAVEMSLYLDGFKTGVSITNGGDTDTGQVKVLGGDCNDSDAPYGINHFDAEIVGPQFGNSGTSITDSRADINDDYTVNILDCSILGGNWHKSSPVNWP